MTQQTKLKPCPFCGATAHFDIDDDNWEWVECADCGMQGNRSASLGEDCKPKLAEAWNRRAGTDQRAHSRSSQHERDSHFFLAGWNGHMKLADASLIFQQAITKAPTVAAAPAADTPEEAEQRTRWLEIGKALERACADLPDGAEIIVAMERHAGTVTLIDASGIEHENFQHEDSLAGVINEATDTAITIAAAKGIAA